MGFACVALELEASPTCGDEEAGPPPASDPEEIGLETKEMEVVVEKVDGAAVVDKVERAAVVIAVSEVVDVTSTDI